MINLVKCPHCKTWRSIEPDWKSMTNCPLCINTEKVTKELYAAYLLRFGHQIPMDRDDNKINELRIQFKS